MRNLHTYLTGILCAAALAGCAHDGDEQAVADPPYAVGSSTRFIHDFSRGYDSVAGIESGLRILITETWYPVEHRAVAGGRYRHATYGDYVFGDRDMHRLMMTATTFFHLTPETVRAGVTAAAIDAAIDELYERERVSFVDAPLARASQPWPVIVMSHGDAGSRYNMETACEYLAAHGYVVIAPEHTGNSPYSLTGKDPALATEGGDATIRGRMADVLPLLDSRGAYGRKEAYGQSYAPFSSGLGDPGAFFDLDRSLLQRVNDLRATLAELERMNRAGAFANRLDLGKIGLMGRSFGGATTLAALALEPRFTAGVAVVPLVMPDIRDSLPPELLRAAGEESVLLSSDGPFALGEITSPTLILNGAEDGLIIGFLDALAAPLATVAPTAENPYPILSSAFESTAEPVVWGLLANSNHGSFGVSGPYWWPELKPDSQRRYFEPDTTFKLVNSGTAHRVQQELILDFFDLTIRDDASAKGRLLDDRFSAHGLILRSRNL